MITIGIVCEGDRDYDMICATITQFMGQAYHFIWIQPNPEFGTQFGNGWKGVWRWCETQSDSLNEYMRGITPQIDVLIIQMDADVARAEKEAYCTKVIVACPAQKIEHPLNCPIAINHQCIQALPPNSVCDGSVQGRVNYLTGILSELINNKDNLPVVITIPCDSTDSWILAAFEEPYPNIEAVNSPWDIITHSKTYHGIRIPGKKKSKRPYEKLIKQVCENWKTVTEKCPQSKLFEENVRALLCSINE